MCKATEIMRNNAEARGKVIGAIDILKDYGLPNEEIVKRVAKKYNASEKFVRTLLENSSAFTKERMLSDINLSEKQIDEGDGIDATEAVMALRKKHGFACRE